MQEKTPNDRNAQVKKGNHWNWSSLKSKYDLSKIRKYKIGQNINIKLSLSKICSFRNRGWPSRLKSNVKPWMWASRRSDLTKDIISNRALK